MIDTKGRILAAAEGLFAEQGYAATSLRHIIAQAGVNLAAIHYHFGSKEDLLDQLVSTFADPVNRARVALLERYEAEAHGAALPVEKILEAFFLPAAQLATTGAIKLMGRLYGEGLMPAIVERHFKPTGKRFVTALRRTLAYLPDEEFFWRIDFMIGAMAHAMMGGRVFGAETAPVRSNGGGAAGRDTVDISPGSRAARHLACLVAFLAAGFRAPACLTHEKVEAAR
jgi:AcrR family transcriptional regulator